MFGRSDPQQWTVHAEFTIKHDGMEETSASPKTHTERDENGVRMVYSWTSQPPTSNTTNTNESQSFRTDRSSTSSVSDVKVPQLPYGFQRGNLVFTSTPPKKSPYSDAGKSHLDSSGYSSEMLSPNSGSLPYRPIQPYNRRCRSTCSIVLSADFDQKADEATDAQSQCGRTQSLRCQTPTAKSERKDFYGCGDPWCYHACGEEYCRFPPLQECDEYGSTTSSKRPSRASTFTVRQSDRSKSSPSKIDTKRDASVQTYEMIDKCTSPFLRTDSFDRKSSDDEVRLKREKNFKKKVNSYESRRKTEPIHQRQHSPASFTPDSLDNQQSVKRAVKVPAKYGRSFDTKSSSPDSKASDKKPRTVHIDVYCTGTEIESSSSSCSDSENKTTSSPQTVFESEKFRLTHKRVADTGVPYHLRKSKSNDSSSNVQNLRRKFEKDESDDDGASTAYPSQLSSFSAIKDIGSSFSTSVPPSWSTMSMTSCALPDDDSVANTSWKDTYSDIGSLLESRSSITQTDSLDFVPRKFLHHGSIDESPENRSLADTSSKASLQPSDSFEYANSEDRARIKKMERAWGGQDKQWKSPQIQRKYLVQQKKLKEYMDKRMSDKSLPKWESKDTDSEGTDSEEKGWTIIKEENTLEEDPSKKASVKECTAKNFLSAPTVHSISTSKSPSFMLIRQRLSLDPNIGSPFTMYPGVFTEQRAVAKKFGNVVNIFRKPGHHIGPAKNPHCACEHCRRYFEIYGVRARAKSLSENSGVINWTDINRSSVPPEAISSNNEPETIKENSAYTDF